ncbi:GNAT family N-acetyltransferase [Dethiosulfovibrio sp. F2B]|uniref:GNAT family N-acetyltransferase n=1 Tax=Dethiosulfovibrio faecalis TaxID=2720018 RepID=UPI001F253A39|nr:GNAT family N-acetyltransferase [Dethiosulfovibrio faecalis]MCF4150712.1 GNAT family N-acetyltransferase [Dethiosulfovibrio faecalis]
MILFDIDFCGPEDGPAIVDIDLRSNRNPWPLPSVMDDLRNRSGEMVYMGAFKKDILLGFIALERRRKLVWIMQLAVSPDWRRFGIGEQLLCSAYAIGEEWGCRGVGLTVRVSNSGARALYQKNGFVQGAILPGYYGDGEDGIRMQRNSLIT